MSRLPREVDVTSKAYSSEGCADAMCRDAERLEPPHIGYDLGAGDDRTTYWPDPKELAFIICNEIRADIDPRDADRAAVEILKYLSGLSAGQS